MKIIKVLKIRKMLVDEIRNKDFRIEEQRKRLRIYEMREDDIRALQREITELRDILEQKNALIIRMQEERINYLQNEREFEETNEKLETENETLKDIIKGSKTIGTARKEADKLKEME